MAPKGSAEVLSSVPKCKEAVMCLREKIHVLDKLHSAVRYSGHGFEVSIAAIYTK